MIFISFQERLQLFAALGTFHLAANNISIDLRVSGLNLMLSNELLSLFEILLPFLVVFGM